MLSAVDPKPIRVKPAADIVNLLLMPVQLILMKWVVDRIQAWNGGAVERDFLAMASLLAAVMIAQAIISRASLLSYNRLSEIGAYEVERAILVKTSKLTLALLESPAIKDLRTRAFRVSPELLFLNGTGFLLQTPQLILLLSILYWYGHWIVVMIFVLVLPIQLSVRTYAAKASERLEQQQIPQRTMAQYLSRTMTSRQSAKEIRLLSLAQEFQARWMRLHQETGRQWIHRKMKEQLALAPSELIISMVSGLMAGIVLITSAVKGQSAGEIAILLQIAIMLGGMWPSMVDQYASLKQQGVRWDDLTQYLQLEEDSVYTEAGTHPPSSRTIDSSEVMTDRRPGSLLVKQLTFSYPGIRQPVLHQISFQIEAGEKVAIVGENGAGKSTLVKLMMGLYTPASGFIEWFSKAGVKLSAADASVGFTAVLQNFTKLNLSVREQVALGRIHYLHNDPKLLDALVKANASGWGWDLDDRIGPEFGGKELSGGQWQRLATARAYVRDGSVLFFDEPTSALDPQAEKTAMEDFYRIAGDRTAFLVTHRLGAARLADRILVLRQGELVEQGTHEQLIAKRGEYERLYRLQASWYV